MARHGSHFAPHQEGVTRPVPLGRSPRRGSGPRMRRPLIAGIAVAALALCVVGGALAWLVSSDSLTNVFGVGSVDVEVNEQGPDGGMFEPGTDTEKKNVTVKNTGSVDAYVRVQVSCYYVDKNGSQVWEKPTVTSTLSTSAHWLKTSGSTDPDGTYYYAAYLAPGAETDTLFDSIKDADPDRTASMGWTFVCDISVQSIQANPLAAVEEAWSDVNVDANGNLTLAATSTTTDEEA